MNVFQCSVLSIFFILFTTHSVEGFTSLRAPFKRSQALSASGRGQKARQTPKEPPAPPPTAEFSRIYSMQQLRNGKTLVLEPKPEEIEGLSNRFKVETVLHCRVTLTSSGMPGLKNCVKVDGKLESMVVQACMVSGEPLSSSIYSEFECVIAEAGDSQSLALLSELDHFDIEEVDAGGSVDLGEIAAQYLGLEISPYPTGPGVKLDLPSSDSDGDIDNGQELKLP